MKFLDLFFKRAVGSPMLALVAPPTATHSPRTFQSFSEEGYQKNVVVFRCIEKVTDALASAPMSLKKKAGLNGQAEEIFDHPVIRLLQKPNPSQSYQSFVKSTFGFFLISGNSFLHAIAKSEGKEIIELWGIRPDKMTVKPGVLRIPLYYEQRVSESQTRRYDVDQIDGSSSILHMKTFNPLNDWLGMSQIEAASFPVDQYNASGKWNLALLQNGARPSGAFVLKPEVGKPSQMTEPQRAFLKEQLDSQYNGAKNAGRPLLLEGGLDWREMSVNPKDMDWINGKHTTARDIALAFGVPPQLLGIPGDNTYANYHEAKLAFYIDTVIPLLKFWADHLNNWLVPAFDESVALEPDLNRIEALEPLREKKWTQVNTATALTINEKRELLGYGKYKATQDPADMIFVGMGLVPLEDVLTAAEDEDDETDPNATDDFESVDEEDETEGADDESDDEDTEDADTDEEESEPKTRFTALIDGKAVNLNSKKKREAYRRQLIERRGRLEKVFASQLKAVWKKEAAHVANAVKGVNRSVLEFAVSAAIQDNEKAMEAVLTHNISQIMRYFADDILALAKFYPGHAIETKDADTRFESFLHNYVKRHVGNRIKTISETSAKRVVKALREGFAEDLEEGATPDEMVRMVKETYNKFSSGRAATIVRTETGIAQNESQRAAAKALNVPGLKKTWISDQTETARDFSNGDHTDHTVMMEISVGINDKFSVPSLDGNDDMEGPGDPNAPASQVINCKCVNVFGKGED